ncbi:glutathione S-transferase [Methyloceanibacter stevinii]|uniref:Glutathione S-transferase n=1 Tax=Methyloceanibacter stevinii TaxID=1774970 RepID=A0A1E3VUT6_9HYPH|nr:glutathione S-transferase [Methyloceanibacter stevinii]ODR97287.1 glutathione S-transferase [Methyloceanibacter stevinii]
MSDLKLTYFDFHGGRGEPARLALAMGGVPFHDDRVPMADWPERKAATPFGALPVLVADGKVLTQSNAINRYVGKLTGLYPSDFWQAALCDETMDAVEDLLNVIVPTMFMPDDEKKARREELVEGMFPLYLKRLNQNLADHGGRYFADDRLTIADLKVAMLIRQMTSGIMDHVPTDLVEKVAPGLIEHFQRVMKDPSIKAYYAKKGVEV